jgi:hypothetical protein
VVAIACSGLLHRHGQYWSIWDLIRRNERRRVAECGAGMPESRSGDVCATPGCTFNFQSVTFNTGPLLGTFVSTTNPMSVASYQIPNGGNNVFANLITSVDVFLTSPIILLSSVSIAAPCGSALSFGAEGEFNLGTLTLLSCDTVLATASVTSVSLVPEPGTFALLLGAIAAGWLARRIKRKP